MASVGEGRRLAEEQAEWKSEGVESEEKEDHEDVTKAASGWQMTKELLRSRRGHLNP